MDKYSYSFPPVVTIEVDISGSTGTVSFAEPTGITGGATGPTNHRRKICSDEYGTPPTVYCAQPKEGETWDSVDDSSDLDWSSHAP